MPQCKNSYSTNSPLRQDDVESESCCNKRTGLEKCTLVALFLFVAKSIGLGVILFLLWRSQQYGNKNANNISEEDFKIGKGIGGWYAAVEDQINEEVNPCDDFFEFSCGKFQTAKRIPLNQVEFHAFQDTQDLQMATLEYEWRKSGLNQIGSEAKKMADIFISKCVNAADPQGEDGLSPLKTVLEEFGGWPLASRGNWNPSLSYQEASSLSMELGFSGDVLLAMSYDHDFRDVSRKVIYLEPPPRSSPLEVILQNKTQKNLESYLEFLSHAAHRLGAPQSDATEKDLAEVFKLEMRIHSVQKISHLELNLTGTFKSMKMRELRDTVPGIKWISHAKKLLGLEKIVKGQEVIVTNPEYLAVLNSILETQPNRVLMNFILWKIILESERFLPPEFSKISQFWRENISEQEEEVSRKKWCTRLAVEMLPYSDQLLPLDPNTSIEGSEEVFRAIQTHLQKSLLKSRWMKRETRQKIALRVEELKFRFGAFESDVDRFYGQFQLPDQNASFLDIYRHISLYKRKKLSASNLEIPNYISRPFYDELNSTIHFPVVPEKWLYQSNYPSFVNFARFGFYSAHFMHRSFYPNVLNHKEKGTEGSIWEAKDQDKLEQKIRCLVDPGNDEDFKISSELSSTLTSDFGGLKQAYSSYRDWDRRYSTRPLKHSKYAPNQMFWLSFAQLMCSSKTPGLGGGGVRVGKRRVNTALRNLEEFSRDWKCGLNSSMNPIEKCSLWLEG